jgi:hypothetical protein
MRAAQRGWSAEETADKLMEVSAKAQERARLRDEGYALATAQNAAAAARVDARQAEGRVWNCQGRASADMITPMKFGEYEFECICDIVPLRGTNGSLTQFMPQERYRNARNLPLNKYGAGPFCKFTIPSRYQVSGVYILTVDEEPRYVGECANFSARFNAGYGNISPKNCFRGGQETNCRLNNLLYAANLAGKHVSLWFLQTADYKQVEANLRYALKPAWNRI